MGLVHEVKTLGAMASQNDKTLLWYGLFVKQNVKKNNGDA